MLDGVRGGALGRRSTGFAVDGDCVAASTRGGVGRLSACDGDVIGPRPGIGVVCGGVVRTGGAVKVVSGELGGIGSGAGDAAVGGGTIAGELVIEGGTGALDGDGAVFCASLPSSQGATTQRAVA